MGEVRAKVRSVKVLLEELMQWVVCIDSIGENYGRDQVFCGLFEYGLAVKKNGVNITVIDGPSVEFNLARYYIFFKVESLYKCRNVSTYVLRFEFNILCYYLIDNFLTLLW